MDKGDIDILAIDDSRRIVYSIEFKNTHQSKVAYEYKTEIENYLGISHDKSLIIKHINRDIWLRNNAEMVLAKLGLESDYVIRSLVVTKHILPTKFLKKVDMDILSLYELKKNGLPK